MTIFDYLLFFGFYLPTFWLFGGGRRTMDEP